MGIYSNDGTLIFWGCHHCYICLVALFNILAIAAPRCCAGVGSHYPAILQAQAAACGLRAVGHCCAFELLGKETSCECCEPLFYCCTIVFSFKGVACHKMDFSGRETVVQEVIQEKVV